MSEIQQGLLIAAIGMGLVFAIIIFLWGLMALMMRVTSREKSEVGLETLEAHIETEEGTPNSPRDNLPEAAAAAVVVCFALDKIKTRKIDQQIVGATNTLSPWQIVHRNHQIEQKRM